MWPHSEWTTKGEDGAIVNTEGLVALVNARLREMPGVEYNFSRIVEDNVEEALSGVKGELAIKAFGDDLAKVHEVGAFVAAVLTRLVLPVIHELIESTFPAEPTTIGDLAE